MDIERTPVVLPIKLTPSQVRPVAYRIMSKKHGLNLKSAALDVLAAFLGHHFGADWRGAKAERFLDDLAKLWKDDDRGVFVDGEPLSRLIANLVNAQLSQSGDQDAERKFDYKDYFKVISAKDQRRTTYNYVKKHFELTGGGEVGKTLGATEALVHMFPTRFHLLSDRIYRNDQFQSRSYTTNDESYMVTRIKNMLGRDKEEFFLFGLLTNLDDQWWLLDNSGKIRLEMTDTSAFAPGHYYTSGSFVLCYGVYLGDHFQVGTLGPPPVERREATKDAYGNLDFYGIASSVSTRLEHVDPALEEILVAEEHRLDHRMVVLGSDVHLDSPETVGGLRRVLTQIAERPPLVLIVPGSFFSRPFQGGDTSAYREAMNTLATVLQELPNLTKNTKIVMVPGENDPWQAMVSKGGTPMWPLDPVPELFTGRVVRAAPDVVWASNPCRVCYLSQEIVISRDNLGELLRRHSLRPPGDVNEEPQAEPQAKTQAEPKAKPQTGQPEGQTIEVDGDDDGDAMASQRALRQMQAENDIRPAGRPVPQSDHEARKVIATVLDQCHLSPFSLSVRPVVWEHDMALSLIQWPSTLLLVDPTTPRFKHIYEGCNVANPGRFVQNKRAQWLEIQLGTSRCELMSTPL